MVENAAELRQYTFKQRTEVSMNGEVKSVRLDQVRFDLDGKMERTPLTPVAAEAPRGLRGKMAAKKREEAADFVERLMSLARRYLAPGRGDLEKLSSKAEIWKGRGATGNQQVRIQATDFVKSGDSFVWTLDAVAKLPVRMEARTELDGDPVTITAEYRTLPGGPNYVARAIVKSARKELEVKVESFDYERN
ncbi:MAG: hypothetical protein IPM24_13365 [Bryobacterales bacterium]|nr:hypothetical protein [Bryobacterales bacterium]